MFIAFLIAYLFPDSFSTPDNAQKLTQLLLFGVFSTSLTMSVYYWYIGLYYQRAFARGWDIIILLILVFFAVRLLLHYNTENIWFSMMLPAGQPNYSAWLRNIPLFIYGLLAVVTVLLFSWKRYQKASGMRRQIEACVQLAMLSLIISFIVYAVDVFYSHRIPHAYIWIVYTIKTLAYMAAFFFMWLGEFYFGSKLSLAETRHAD
jgi:hypothetical protein